jgi:hypothetical protein
VRSNQNLVPAAMVFAVRVGLPRAHRAPVEEPVAAAQL